MKKLSLFLFPILLFSIMIGQISLALTITPIPSSAVGVTFAYVHWGTDSASDSRVDYGTTTAYGSSVTDATSSKYHTLTVSGLSANTVYHYMVTSGGVASADYTFTTAASPTGTVKTVKSSGGDYTTISACVSAASAGWTCLVYNGTYSNAITGKSGSAGNPITIQAQEPAVISGTLTFGSGNQYFVVKGMKFTGGHSICSGSCNSTGTNVTSYITLDNNWFYGSSIELGYNTTSAPYYNSSYWKITNNFFSDGVSDNKAIEGQFGYTFIDNNQIWHYGNDWIYAGMINAVVRNNTGQDLSPVNPGDSGDHVDFLQSEGPFQSVLFEGNKLLKCTDATGNCHYIIAQPAVGSVTNDIIRYNFAEYVDFANFQFDYAANSNIRVYNNTILGENTATGDGFCSVFTNTTNSIVKNMICHNTQAARSYSPIAGQTSQAGNLVYHTGYSGSWGTAYAYQNQDPGFSNYPYSASLSSGSYAVDKGTALTTVSSGCSASTTSITVADALYFQDGSWVPSGLVNADWIAVGTVSNTVQISSISSNTITLSNTISCTNGANVWLYKKSDGLRVLYGSAPDIGAYEYNGSPDQMAPPGGLRIVSP